jgi:hypothetical protein
MTGTKARKQRSGRRLRRLLWLGLLPLAAMSPACNTYSYFDLDMKVGSGFDTVMIGRILSCHVFVGGATTDDFTLDYAKCHTINAGTQDIGKIQYSTFADSGSNVIFTLRLFEKVESDACELGHGSTTLTVDSGKTVAGTVTAPYIGPGCP